MKTLYILYDAHCGLCRRMRIWLGGEPAYVELKFMPFQSEGLTDRFPGIESFDPSERMLVINEGGELWRGEHAWVMCLWALREYRELSLRLAHPALLPMVGKVCDLISNNRHAISDWLSRLSFGALRTKLADLPEPCEDSNCRIGSRLFAHPGKDGVIGA